MTEKLYEVDSYVQNFTAQVVSCTPVPGGFAVVLDRTAFFPEGGGQPCDTGRLGGARVLAVHTDGETITHTTDTPLTAGETVDGCLDWPARLDAMQQHTGEHILSGALHRLFGAENVGFHIGSPYVRMDTSIPLTQEQLAQAEAEANAAVRADTPVHCWVPDPETLARTDYRSKKELTGDVRLVEAGGDCCACCGTHLTRTGEVGLIKIISFAHYKSGMRLAVACGQRAYDAVAGIWADTEAAGRLLSSPVGSLTPALERLQNGEAVFAFVGTSSRKTIFSYHTVCRDRMVLITPNNKEFAEKKEMGVLGKELLEWPMIMRESGSGTRRETDNYLKSIGMSSADLNVAGYMNNIEGIKSMVAAGKGITILSERAAADAIRDGRVLCFDLEEDGPYRDIYIAYLKNRSFTQTEQAFLNYVRNRSGEKPKQNKNNKKPLKEE